jgi:hypothetical protein
MANAPEDDKLYTGTGGFIIDEPDTRYPGIYTLDVGSDTQPGDPNYPLRDVALHGGNVNVDHTPKDISPATKTTLADYLGRKTSATNYYRVTGDDGYREESIYGPSGPGSRLVPSIPEARRPTSNTVWFTQGKDSINGVTAQSTELPLRQWQTTRTTDDTPETLLNSVVIKGKSPGAVETSRNGNDLLPEVDVRPGDGPVNIGTQNVLSRYQNAVLSANRFAVIAERSQSFDSDSLVKKSTIKDADGKSSTKSTTDQLTQYNPTFYHPKYGEITAGRLAQVGTALSLRASGEFAKAPEAANDPNVVQTSWLAKQLTAQKIDLVELEVDRIIKELEVEDLREVFYTNISDNSSWGNVNNVLYQSAGLSSMAMSALAIAMSAGIGVIVGIFFNLILNNISALNGNELIKRTNSQFTKTDDSYEANPRYLKGSSTNTGGTEDKVFRFFADLVGMVPTSYSYSEAVGKGNAIYFGLDTLEEGQSRLGTLTTTVLNTVRASSQVVSLSRMIIRSSVGIYENFADAFRPGLGGLNLDRISRLLSALESIGRSKLMAALNMFATIGDAALTAKFYEDSEEENKDLTGMMYYDVHTDRVGIGNFKLPWASNMAASKFLLPGFLKDSKLTQFSGAPRRTEPEYQARQHFHKSGSISRIPFEDVDALESMLDSEYVPFYFHDIRTNEIVAFHAFLESLSDDYTASYDSVEGIGRIEPVKIYKGTQRKIGMSFFVVSTSPQDFEDMWVKINKLTTLLYPQYSEGRRHKVGDNYNFIQPFSQLVGASPLVRIRLGNLLRSNYSKFALARLFGAHINKEEEGTKFGLVNNPAAPATPAAKPVRDTVESVDDRILREKSKPGTQWNLVAHTRVTLTAAPVIGVPSRPPRSKNIIQQIELPFDALVELNSAPRYHPGAGNSLGYQTFSVKFIKPTDKIGKKDPRYPYFVDPRSDKYLLSNIFKVVGSSFLDSTESTKKRVEAEYQADLLAPQATQAAPAAQAPQTETEKIAALAAFMSEENNALVKSFKSASGKGLAGVIESMNFDWYSNVTWDVDKGKKAPKMCKVTISFSPMHDISPGLDSYGYNRAPIYPGSDNDPAEPKS